MNKCHRIQYERYEIGHVFYNHTPDKAIKRKRSGGVPKSPRWHLSDGPLYSPSPLLLSPAPIRFYGDVTNEKANKTQINSDILYETQENRKTPYNLHNSILLRYKFITWKFLEGRAGHLPPFQTPSVLLPPLSVTPRTQPLHSASPPAAHI